MLKASRATGLSRRHLLTLLGGAAAATMAPSLALAAPRDGVRRLTLHNLHTGEKLTAAYWEKGCYDRTELDAVARLCRDFRTGEVHPIDCELLDLVHRLGRTLAASKPIELISAYRSPKTNAVLAAQSSGVAKRSQAVGAFRDLLNAVVRLKQIVDAAVNAVRRRFGACLHNGFQ